MPRNGDSQAGFHDGTDGAEVDKVYTTEFACEEETTHQRECGPQLARKTDLGRFQWATNDEGVASFLQRPPSRQKEAFPTHLADVIPYPAFQVSSNFST